MNDSHLTLKYNRMLYLIDDKNFILRILLESKIIVDDNLLNRRNINFRRCPKCLYGYFKLVKYS